MKVISFGLWGDCPRYTIGAIKNCELAQKYYPDWDLFFHVDQTVPGSIIQELESMPRTRIIRMKEVGSPKSMVWRFYPCSNYIVSILLSRDTDSRISLRERDAVEEWLESGNFLHVMRDHPYHTVPIMGGLWGVRCSQVRDMIILLQQFALTGVPDQVCYDQRFLEEVIWPRLKAYAMEHDSGNPVARRFRIPRDSQGVYYAGEQFDPGEILHSQKLREILDASPTHSRERSA